jgi:hypothetical protein
MRRPGEEIRDEAEVARAERSRIQVKAETPDLKPMMLRMTLFIALSSIFCFLVIGKILMPILFR